jgi:hypothetical protein
VAGTTVTGATGVFTNVTGTTITGTTINATTGVYQTLTASNLVFTSATVSGDFTVLGSGSFASGVRVTGTLSGTTITGTVGSFSTITGGIATLVSGVFAQGSATNPSISISGDSDTGLFSPGANQLGITVSGSQKVVINNSGLVTISGSLDNPLITGTIIEDVYTIVDGAAFEVDPGNGSVQLITLGASRTPKATNFLAGESITLMVNDGASYALTWTDTTWGAAGVIWTGGSAPTLALTGYTVIQFWKVSTQVYGALVGEVA